MRKKVKKGPGERKAEFLIIVGEPGSGKTFFTENIVKGVIKKRPTTKVLFIQENDNEEKINKYPLININSKAEMIAWQKSKQKIKRVNAIDFDDEKVYETIRDRIRFYPDMLLLFDDAANYTPQKIADKNNPVRKLLVDRRKAGSDVIITFHNFAEIPPKIFSYQPNLFIGETLPYAEAQFKKMLSGRAGENLFKITRMINLMCEKKKYTFKYVNIKNLYKI